MTGLGDYKREAGDGRLYSIYDVTIGDYRKGRQETVDNRYIQTTFSAPPFRAVDTTLSDGCNINLNQIISELVVPGGLVEPPFPGNLENCSSNLIGSTLHRHGRIYI